MLTANDEFCRTRSQVRKHSQSEFVYHSSAFMSKTMTKELFMTSMLPDAFGDLIVVGIVWRSVPH